MEADEGPLVRSITGNFMQSTPRLKCFHNNRDHVPGHDEVPVIELLTYRSCDSWAWLTACFPNNEHCLFCTYSLSRKYIYPSVFYPS